MRKGLTILAGAIALLVVAGSMAAYFLLSQQAMRVVELETWEFGFNRHLGGPTLRLKAGEQVKATLVNRGGLIHEFMVVRDASQFAADVRNVVEELKAKGLSEDEVEKSHELHEVHDEYALRVITIDGSELAEVEVEPGEVKDFILKIDEPGIYYYVCGELAGTYPNTHLDKGMVGKIIVE